MAKTNLNVKISECDYLLLYALNEETYFRSFFKFKRIDLSEVHIYFLCGFKHTLHESKGHVKHQQILQQQSTFSIHP